MPENAPIDIPPPDGVYAEPFSLRKLTRLLAFFGPAAVMTSVSIGAGETLVVVITGAWARYQLLWIVLLAVIVKGLFTSYLIGRYTAITGRSLGSRMGSLPGVLGWLPLVLVACELIGAAPICAVIARPCGNLLAFVLRDVLPNGSTLSWETILAVAFTAVALLVSIGLSYEWLERQNLILCGVLVGGTVLASMWVRPDFGEAARGFVEPRLPLAPWSITASDGTISQIPENAARYNLTYVLMLITVFGYVGNTVFGYIVYGNWVGIHRWGLTGHPQMAQIRRDRAPSDLSYLPDDPEQAARAHRRLLPLKWDVAMGGLVLLIVSASFMMAGAQVLYPRIDADPAHAIPKWSQVLTDQRHVWMELHPWLVPVYYVCLMAALWGTLNALPEIWCRVSKEFVGAVWPRVERWGYEPTKRVLVAVVLILTTVLLVTDVNIQWLALWVATLTTGLAVALVCGCAVYFNATLPRLYRPPIWLTIGGILSTLVLSIASLGGLLGLLR